VASLASGTGASGLTDVSDLVGIPFVDKGRSKDGADCYGIFSLAMERFGITVPPVSVSAFAVHEAFAEFRRQVEQERLWIPVADPLPGDAVVMRNDPQMPRLIQHFGVCIGEGKFLHALEKTGSVIARLDHPLWKNRIAGAYRWNSR
jgi:cell wall-associated NlpC family hydrolase